MVLFQVIPTPPKGWCHLLYYVSAHSVREPVNHLDHREETEAQAKAHQTADLKAILPHFMLMIKDYANDANEIC